MNVILRLAIVSLLGVSSQARSALVISTPIGVEAFDRGWYREDGEHDPLNQNQSTGWISLQEYRSFILWNVPDFEGELLSARLRVSMEYPFYLLQSSGHMYDILPQSLSLISTPDGSGQGLSIFADLGSGFRYGSVSTVGAGRNEWLSFELSEAAVAAISEARGEVFGIGFRNSNSSGRFLFSTGNLLGSQRLELDVAVIPEPRPQLLFLALLLPLLVRVRSTL